MEHIYLIISVWLGIAVLSSIVAYHLKLSIALIEICFGIIVSFFMQKYFQFDFLNNNSDLIKFLSGSGAIFLTFLAGAELDKHTIKSKFKESFILGFVSFLPAFLIAFLFSFYFLHWSRNESLLSAIVLSSTSIAIIYSVMIEFGLNKTDLGKGILGACFVNGILTLVSLSFFFSNPDYKLFIFIIISLIVFFLFPYITNHLTEIYGNKTAAIRVKWVSFSLFSLGALALWAKTEPVLTAYLLGLVLGEFALKNTLWINRLRTLTIGFLTPFYFIRVGTLCSLDPLFTAFFIISLFFIFRLLAKMIGIYPITKFFRKHKKERLYYTFLLSTGLTFDTIAAVFGYTHNIINKNQYSILTLTIILSAIIPAILALKFTPRHLLKRDKNEGKDIVESFQE